MIVFDLETDLIILGIGLVVVLALLLFCRFLVRIGKFLRWLS